MYRDQHELDQLLNFYHRYFDIHYNSKYHDNINSPFISLYIMDGNIISFGIGQCLLIFINSSVYYWYHKSVVVIMILILSPTLMLFIRSLFVAIFIFCIKITLTNYTFCSIIILLIQWIGIPTIYRVIIIKGFCCKQTP